jgi:hypothetical protein
MHGPSRTFFQTLLLLICLRGPAELCAQSSVDHQNVLAAVHSRRVHAFFYLWYGTPEVDGKWQHWDHEVLPHWDASLRDRYPNPNPRGFDDHDVVLMINPKP